MKTAANLLRSKAHQSVHTVTPEASVFDALKLMADKNIGALLVMAKLNATGKKMLKSKRAKRKVTATVSIDEGGVKTKVTLKFTLQGGNTK